MMERNSGDFSMEEAMRLVNSPAGQQLLALLQQSDTETMHRAMEQALRGDFSQAQQTLSDVASSPEVKKLLQQMGG